MAKIGFIRDEEEEKKTEKKKKEPSMFQQLLQERFSPTGAPENIRFLSTAELCWVFRHMVEVPDYEEVNKVLRGLGYQTKYLDDVGELCWVLYDRVFQSL